MKASAGKAGWAHSILKKKDKPMYLYFCMDTLRFLCFCCFCYTLLLLLDYTQFLSGSHAFAPAAYLPWLGLALLQHGNRSILRRMPLVLAGGAFVSFLCFRYYPSETRRLTAGWVMLAAVLLEWLGSLQHARMAKSGDVHILRREIVVWGAGSLFLMPIPWIFARRELSLTVKPSYCLRWMSVVFCCYILFLLLYEYAALFFGYFRRKKRVDPVMRQQVRRVMAFAAAFAAAAGIVIFLISGYGAGLLGSLFAKIPAITGKKATPEPEMSAAPYDNTLPNNLQESMENMEGQMKFGQAGPLGKILTVLFMLLFAATILYLLYRFYKSISGMTFNRAVESDEIHVETEEGTRQTSLRRRFHFYRHGSGVNESIRRSYYRMLVKLRMKGKLKDLSVMTTEDIEKEISKERKCKAQMEELTGLYQAARYGNDMLAAEDAENAKQLSESIAEHIF